jgi:polysaccharide deacetylase 2 family uncharacterized protein YibQ
MAWFAVKTLYRSAASGRPQARDEKYRAGVASLEERVVLFRARDGKSAIRKALAEAGKYAKANSRTNVYGQEITMTPLEFAEVHQLFDEPGDGVEVFSLIQIIPSRMTPPAIIERVAGEAPTNETAPMFIAGFLTEALRDDGVDI